MFTCVNEDVNHVIYWRMLFRSRPPDLELHLKINNAEIPKVTETKLLGIIIDDRLNWKPHIQSVKYKLSCILSIMYKASKLITTANELFKELYILKFPEFVQYKTAILMFHLFHGTLPIHLQNRFTRNSTQFLLRVVLAVLIHRTNIKAMCLSVYGVKLWNSLSTNLWDCNSVLRKI